jgi:hypothetical protein
MVLHENLVMHITDDFFYFQPSSISKTYECLAIDKTLNEADYIS